MEPHLHHHTETILHSGAYIRALCACLIVAISLAPIGVLLVQRRMSLVADAMSHAVLPGVALAFFLTGTALVPMFLFGTASGMAVALAAYLVSRFTPLREEGGFAGFYAISLSVGGILLSLHAEPEEIAHMLFGDVLASTPSGLWLAAIIAWVTLAILAVALRPIIMDGVDPGYLRRIGRRGMLAPLLFQFCLAINLVGAFQIVGALLAMGLMVLPALAAGFWCTRLSGYFMLSTVSACLASAAGLLLAHGTGWPPGPSITLLSGAWFLLSLLVGSQRSIRTQFFPPKHLAA